MPRNTRIVKSRTDPIHSNRTTLLQNVTELLHEIDHYLEKYPPEIDNSKIGDERSTKPGSQDFFSSPNPVASLSCNIENLNDANALIPSSSDRPVDESCQTSDREYPYTQRADYQQYVVPSSSDANTFDQAVEEFSRIRTCLRSNNGNDICYIADTLGNGRLYVINDFGYSLTCVSLSEQQLYIIKRNEGAFHSALRSKGISKKEYAFLLEWQKIISGRTSTSEVSNEIVWNDIKYKRQNSSYCYKAQAFERSSPIWLIKPCKSYFESGVCCDDDCLYLHDPTNALWCKKLFANIKSSVSQFSLKCSQNTNEFTIPICELNLNDLCRYSKALESGKLAENICQYWHGTTAKSNYPVCRRFAHTGFCYRGSHCKFKHLRECPDNSMGAPCIYENCNFPHPNVTSTTISKKDIKITNLCDIPGTDYMIPPVLDEEMINKREFAFQATDIKNNLEQCPPSIMYPPTKSTGEGLTIAAEDVTTNTRIDPDEEDVLNADFISL